MSHTEGPWNVNQTGRAFYIMDSADGLIARLMLRPKAVEEQDNARLIAAAPDLLTMAWLLVARFEHVARYCGNGWAKPEDFSIIEQAKAAIAKAKEVPQ